MSEAGVAPMVNDAPPVPWWVPALQQLGIPTVMCVMMGWGIYQAGGKLVDAHIQHMETVAKSLEQISARLGRLEERMPTKNAGTNGVTP